MQPDCQEPLRYLTQAPHSARLMPSPLRVILSERSESKDPFSFTQRGENLYLHDIKPDRCASLSGLVFFVFTKQRFCDRIVLRHFMSK